MTPRRTILIHATAPAKPPVGQPCNGCGLCCAHAPCPLGMVVTRRRQGSCQALAWDAPRNRYVCGVLTSPRTWLPWLPAPWGRKLAARWISAASGCDAALEAVAQG